MDPAGLHSGFRAPHICLDSERHNRVDQSINSELLAGTNRGTLANLPRHRKIWRLLQDLQVKNPTEDAFEGSPAALDGPWELLYSSAESFRCESMTLLVVLSAFQSEI